MRLLCCGSSLPSSRSTWAESSIFQAMPLQSIFKGDGLLFPAADAIQDALGQIEVLEVVEVFEDGLADVEGLGAAGAAGELFQAFFDGLGETNGQHWTSLYKYSIAAGVEGSKLKVKSSRRKEKQRIRDWGQRHRVRSVPLADSAG